MNTEEYLVMAQAYQSGRIKKIKLPSGTEIIIKKLSIFEGITLNEKEKKIRAAADGIDAGTITRKVLELICITGAVSEIPIEKLIDDDLWALYLEIDAFGKAALHGGGGDDTKSFPAEEHGTDKSG